MFVSGFFGQHLYCGTQGNFLQAEIADSWLKPLLSITVRADSSCSLLEILCFLRIKLPCKAEIESKWPRLNWMDRRCRHRLKREFGCICTAPSRGELAASSATAFMQETPGQVRGIPMAFCNTGHRQTELAASWESLEMCILLENSMRFAWMPKVFNYLKMLKQSSYLNMHVGRKERRVVTRGFGLIYLLWALHFHIRIIASGCLSAVIGGCESEAAFGTKH